MGVSDFPGPGSLHSSKGLCRRQEGTQDEESSPKFSLLLKAIMMQREPNLLGVRSVVHFVFYLGFLFLFSSWPHREA